MEKTYNAFSLFLCYSKITIKSWFQYKVDACMRSLAVFFREATGVIVIYLTMLTFDEINGWNTNELLLLFSFVYVTYGILIVFFTGLRDFEFLVNTGQFDRFLLRPRGALFQVIASNSDWFAAIGHGALGICLFIFSANNVQIVWNFWNIIYCISSIIGGVFIQAAIFLVVASLSFFFIKTGSIRELLYWNTRKFANYPISIFPKFVKIFMTYIIPFAFVNYFPATYLLDKDSGEFLGKTFCYITPVIGIVMFGAAYLFWNYSLKRYKSTGN